MSLLFFIFRTLPHTSLFSIKISSPFLFFLFFSLPLIFIFYYFFLYSFFFPFFSFCTIIPIISPFSIFYKYGLREVFIGRDVSFGFYNFARSRPLIIKYAYEPLILIRPLPILYYKISLNSNVFVFV